MSKLNAKDLRQNNFDSNNSEIIKNPIYIILDNVLDTYNVGSIFRLGEAVACTKICLCGLTLIPPNSRIKKASVNTFNLVNWQYYDTAKDAINDFRNINPDGQVYAVEQNKKSVLYNKVEYKAPVAIILGNETFGIKDEILELVDFVVEIPMYGINTSLNVMVSGGIVLYKILDQIKK